MMNVVVLRYVVRQLSVVVVFSLVRLKGRVMVWLFYGDCLVDDCNQECDLCVQWVVQFEQEVFDFGYVLLVEDDSR